MKMTAIGRSALEAREGVRLTSYRDSVGVWTCGVGHTAACGAPIPGPGVTITQEEADAAFAQDLAKFEKAVSDAVKVPLADHQFDALCSVAYNIGDGWFGVGGHQVATFVVKLNSGDTAGCAEHILDFLKPPELMGRRKAEQEQFLTPYSQALPRPTMNQNRIKEPGAAPPIVAAQPEPSPIKTGSNPAPTQPAKSGGLFSALLAALASFGRKAS